MHRDRSALGGQGRRALEEQQKQGRERLQPLYKRLRVPYDGDDAIKHLSTIMFY